MSSTVAKIEAPSLYFKLEQKDGEWVTRQLAYMSKSDVAALLKVSERTVYDLINDADHPLPYFRIPGGRGLRFRLDAVEKWLEQGKD